MYRRLEGRLLPCSRKLVEVNGSKMLLQTKNIDGIERCLIYDGVYEGVTTSVLKKYLKPDMTFVDVGANIGYYTLLGARRGGLVYAFEPEEKNFKDLIGNTRRNNFTNVIPLQKAVGSECGSVTLYVSSEESGEHSVVLKRHCNEMRKIEMVTLDRTVSHVDILKIDTEGNDYNVLLGAKRLLENCSLLITEFWPEGIIKSGHTCEEFWSLVASYFPHIQIADEVEKVLVEESLEEAIKRAGDHKMSVNLVCTK
jgi:FkbM family methyltransferase